MVILVWEDGGYITAQLAWEQMGSGEIYERLTSNGVGFALSTSTFLLWIGG